MTVYLICPAQRLEVWAGWQRLVLGTLLRLVAGDVPTEKNPVLFLVDEAAHIGKMDALENAVTLLRGLGGPYLAVLSIARSNEQVFWRQWWERGAG